MRRRRIAAWGAALLLLPCLPAVAADPDPEAHAEWVDGGRTLYLRYCASCHGESARGDGPVADVLGARPPDLTRLAARYGTPLPTDELARFVDGRRAVRGHGTRAMPVWGERLYAGPRESTPAREKAKRGTIELILLYLGSIQAPVNPEVPR